MARRRVLLVVAVSLAEFGGLVALLAGLLGAVRGFVVAVAAVAAVNTIYLVFIRPWQAHWGATGEEAARPMPGDDITGHGVRCTTRAVTIDAPASQVWPWLTQPGYGRAGWYSYDWDNKGGQPRPEWGEFGARDPVPMMPGSGFEVVQVEDGHYFVASTPGQEMSWCLDLEPLGHQSCRLISRWRAKWFAIPASARWVALSDPGSFLTEHRMLRQIKSRAEQGASGLVT